MPRSRALLFTVNARDCSQHMPCGFIVSDMFTLLLTVMPSHCDNAAAASERTRRVLCPSLLMERKLVPPMFSAYVFSKINTFESLLCYRQAAE